MKKQLQRSLFIAAVVLAFAALRANAQTTSSGAGAMGSSSGTSSSDADGSATSASANRGMGNGSTYDVTGRTTGTSSSTGLHSGISMDEQAYDAASGNTSDSDGKAATGDGKPVPPKHKKVKKPKTPTTGVEPSSSM